MTVTMDDLNIVKTYVEDLDNTTWSFVEHAGQRYILTASDVTEEVMDRMIDLDPQLAIMFLFGLPREDCAVFYGDNDWKIVGECDESCAEGLCTKRIAQSRPEAATIEESYGLLLNFLNS